MVGEIRDGETAEIALQAAQTGHLVLSTLHTNDAISAVTRLLDLGIPAYLVTSSVTAIIAQRLVRKLCSCRNVVAMTSEHVSLLRASGIADIDGKTWIPVGCPECDNIGYKGRIGIYEVLLVDDQIRAAVRAGLRDDEVRALARGAGMRGMQDDAMSKVTSGMTSLEEVLRVVPFEGALKQRCRNCGRALAHSFLFCPYCGTGARQAGISGRTPADRNPLAEGAE